VKLLVELKDEDIAAEVVGVIEAAGMAVGESVIKC
jgi:hypothetical protein